MAANSDMIVAVDVYKSVSTCMWA